MQVVKTKGQVGSDGRLWLGGWGTRKWEAVKNSKPAMVVAQSREKHLYSGSYMFEIKQLHRSFSRECGIRMTENQIFHSLWGLGKSVDLAFSEVCCLSPFVVII